MEGQRIVMGGQMPLSPPLATPLKTSITISWRYKKVSLKYNFVLFRNKTISFNLVTMPGSAKISIIMQFNCLLMYICKSYFSKKDKNMGIFCIKYSYYIYRYTYAKS